MMPQDGIGRLGQRMRSTIVWGYSAGGFARAGLPFQVSQHFLGHFAAVEDPLEEAQPAGPFRHRRRAPEGKAHALRVQLRGFFGELPQQAFACFGRQADTRRPPGRLFPAGPPPVRPGWIPPGRGKRSASRPLRPGAESWKHLPRGHIPPAQLPPPLFCAYFYFCSFLDTKARRLPGECQEME